MNFTIPGKPVPKLRPRVVTHGRRTVAYSPAKSRDYADFVKVVVKNRWQHGLIEKIERPTRVKLTLRFFVSSKPASVPDLVNLAAQIADCLTGFCYDDDSQITELLCYKFQSSKPRVEISVKALPNQPQLYC